jgi:hypothetical protein
VSRLIWGIGALVASAGGAVAFLVGSKRHVDAIKNAIDGKDSDGVPVMPPGSGINFQARITGYWPFSARPDEVKMEGGVNDRKGKPLHTLEDVQAGNAEYVSVSGDPTIFPYGQRISLAEWPNVVFRVVDTGSHFTGAKKIYRAVGREPLDVCVASSSTKVVPNTDAMIFPGDHFDKSSKDVAVNKLGKPSAVGEGFDSLGAEDS